MMNRETQLSLLRKRARHLAELLEDRDRARRIWHDAPSRELASQFNSLLKDATQIIADGSLRRAIRPAWCFQMFPHGVLVVLLLVAVLGVVVWLAYVNNVVIPAMVVLFGVVFGILMIGSTGRPSVNLNWMLASSTSAVLEKTLSLERFIRDHIDVEVMAQQSAQTRPLSEMELKSRVRSLESINKQLKDRNSALQSDNLMLHKELDSLTQKWQLVQTPIPYDIPTDVLDRLEVTERLRLIEAVQAYRVGAWTPAASVCGTILEARLQRLCRENDIELGGIGSMIKRLGEHGLLRGYYQNLAQVGEIFRHRSAHPTTEDFDREKLTLILASLMILLRDLP